MTTIDSNGGGANDDENDDENTTIKQEPVGSEILSMCW